MKKWVGGNSLADLHSSLAPSVSVHFSLHRPVAKQPESADIMLLSKWHSSGEKLLQNHTQFKWNWNNNPRLKRSIALSYQTLQRVGCITVLAITETHSAQGLAFNYLCLMHNMDLKKKSIWLKKKKKNPDTDTQTDEPQQHRVLCSKVACKGSGVEDYCFYSHGSHYYFYITCRRVWNIILEE